MPFDTLARFEDNLLNYVNAQRQLDPDHHLVAPDQAINVKTLVPAWFVADVLFISMNINRNENIFKVCSYFMDDIYDPIFHCTQLFDSNMFVRFRLSYTFAYAIMIDNKFDLFTHILSSQYAYILSKSRNRETTNFFCNSCSNPCIRTVQFTMSSYHYLKVDMLCPRLHTILSDVLSS